MQSEKFIAFNINTVYVRSFVGLFAVLVLIVVPTFAERSVPGDVLYPVKVNFNEEIRSSLSVSPYAKVEWETERLERRISEARLLASEGKLTPEVEESVTKAVQEHSDAAEASIAVIRESDSDDAAIAEIAFETALSVQAEVLENTLEKETDSNAEGRSVAGIASAVAEKKKETEAKHSGTAPSYEKLMAKIETETTRAHELFDSVRVVASYAEEKDIERRLSDIERSIIEAINLHADKATSTTETGAMLEEVVVLRTELSNITKLISFMTDIDVRESVTVEELVPVTLTEAEVAASIVTTQQKIDEEIIALGEMIADSDDGEFTEKIDIAYKHAVQNASSSKIALAENQLEAAQVAADDALAAIGDIKKMLGAVEEDVLPDDTVTSTSTPETETQATTTPVEEIDVEMGV